MKVQLTRNSIIERNVGAVLARRLITRPASTFIMNIEKNIIKADCCRYLISD